MERVVGELFEDNDLRRTAANLERIEAFFVARTSGKVEGPAEESLIRVQRALAALAATIGNHVQRNGLSFPKAKDIRDVPQQAEGSLGALRLAKFAAFLEQVDQWFKSRAEHSLSAGGKGVVRNMHASLTTTAYAAQLLCKGSPINNNVAAASKRSPSAPPPAVKVADVPTRKVNPATMKLELVQTVEQPLLVDFKGATGLAPRTKDLIGIFLTTNEIDLNGYRLRRFEDKVTGWIEATPVGQKLVLKISPVSEEPYPAYVSKDL